MPVLSDREHTPEELRFRAILTAKGLKVRWVAEQSGISRQRIYAMLARSYGHPATPEKQHALARALGVAVSDIWESPQD